MRTAQVYRWIIEGVPSHEVVQKVTDAYGVAERQARHYIKKATDQLEDEMERRGSTTLEAHLTARWHLYSRACEDGDIRTASMILKDIARLECLYAADRSLLAKAGLDESLTAALADPDARAADLLRDALRTPGADS